MSYTVTIKRNRSITELRREWVKVADTGGRDGGVHYDYSPALEVTRQVEEDVYAQTIDDLSLPAVILAINPEAKGQ